MTRIWIIYRVTCRTTGMAYIGQTRRDALTRWAAHVSMTHSGPYNYPLHRAIREHGEDDFTIDILLSCRSKADAYWAEACLIAQHGTLMPHGYNQSAGPGTSKCPKSPLTRAKLGTSRQRILDCQREQRIRSWLALEKRAAKMATADV